MPAVTVRNIPDAVHRALRVRATRHGRSTEAEIRAILDAAVRPSSRVKLGTLMASIAREAGGLTDAESENFTQRDRTMTSLPQLHGFALATRDTTPFHAAGLRVINPWEAVD